MTTYLTIIGDRVALGWVLKSRRMAFPGRTRSEVRSLGVGDELLIYTTRKAFGNPTRDRGRIIGRATVASRVATLEQPVRFGLRDYPVGCDLAIGPLVARGFGVELAPLVPSLDTFANHLRSWPILLRRPLLRLTPRDAKRLGRELRTVLDMHPDSTALEDYSQWYQNDQHPGMNRG
jgi:hypothetical protein